MSSSSSTRSSTSTTTHRVFCFGDSLTAGTSPPGYKDFPYAPHLQATLNDGSGSDRKNHNVMVRHLGYPGWTSDQLLENANGSGGLRTIIQNNKETNPMSVVILLAGTNDLGYERPVDDIVDSVVALHKLCYEESVSHTIAIGIPPSSYQSVVKQAEEDCNEVNMKIQKYCESEPRATYFPFPNTSWSRDDKRWSSDGLHFSAMGYQELGESLAPVVKEILSIK